MADDFHVQPDGSLKAVPVKGEPGPKPKDRTPPKGGPPTDPQSEPLQKEAAARDEAIRKATEAAAMRDNTASGSTPPRRPAAKPEKE